METEDRVFRFGPYVLDARRRQLLRGGEPLKLYPKEFDTLLALVERRGRVVEKDELLNAVWLGAAVEEGNLTTHVSHLRKLLGGAGTDREYIATIPGRGYEFVGQVSELARELGRSEPLTVEAPRFTARRGSPEVRQPPRPSRRVLGFVSVLALVAIGVALSLGGTRSWLVRRFGGTPPAAIRSIVVLPFHNLSGDPAQEYLVDGVGDALTTDLAQIGTLRVISQTSARHYKGTTKRLTEIARELDVDAALEGSVSRAGDRLIVRAQLVRATGEHHLWAKTYESESGDIPEWQGKIALAIARAVHLQIRPDEQRRLARARPVNPDAYDAYLRGRFEWNRRTPEGSLRAIKFFEEAIIKDPQYAPAYSGLSDTYYHLDLQGVAPPAQAMPKAERAAKQALALDDSLAEAHASLAGVLYRYRWDWTAAERGFRRSVDLEPNYEEGRRAYGIYLQTMRRFGESVEQLRRARDLNPLTLRRHLDFVSALFRAGRSEEALTEADRVRGIFPPISARLLNREIAYDHLWRRDWPTAIRAFEKAAPQNTANEWLGYAYAMVGRTSDARAMLAAFHKTAKTQYVAPLKFAVVHFGLGERDEAFRWLEQAFDERAMDLRSLTIGLFSFLHDDARFQDLLRRMGLADFEEFKAREVGISR